MALPGAFEHHLIHWEPEWNQKAEEGLIHSAWLVDLYNLFSLAVGALGSQALQTGWTLYCPPFLLLSGSSTAASSFLGVYLAENRLWDISGSLIMWANILYNKCLFIYCSFICIVGSVPWRAVSNTNTSWMFGDLFTWEREGNLLQSLAVDLN